MQAASCHEPADLSLGQVYILKEHNSGEFQEHVLVSAVIDCITAQTCAKLTIQLQHRDATPALSLLQAPAGSSMPQHTAALVFWVHEERGREGGREAERERVCAAFAQLSPYAPR